MITISPFILYNGGRSRKEWHDVVNKQISTLTRPHRQDGSKKLPRAGAGMCIAAGSQIMKTRALGLSKHVTITETQIRARLVLYPIMITTITVLE